MTQVKAMTVFYPL